MNFSEIGTTQILIVVAVAVLLAAGLAIFLFTRKRRTQRLQAQFGSAEYGRTLKVGRQPA